MMRPNISIILLDTMKLDAFKMLEAKEGRFAKLGFQFLDKCIAPSSWTLPSHASLFTGMYPSEHGAHETKSVKWLDIDRIRLKKATFIGELSRTGYKTYGISANPYVHPIYGFDEFDSFMEESYFTDVFGHVIEIPERLRKKITPYRERFGKDAGKIAIAIMREDPNLLLEAPAVFSATIKSAATKLQAKLIDGWPIEKGGKNIVNAVANAKFRKPFFLFINMMEAHDPYIGKKDLDFNWATPFLKKKPKQALVDRWKKLYQVASAKAYRYGAQIVETLIDRYGDDQVFMITSDHGQEFGEHGFIGHGTVLSDEVLKIPMAVKGPWKKQPKKNNYSSLVKVRDFVMSAASGNEATSELYSNTVYSESFGIPANLTSQGIDNAKVRRYEKYQRRVFR